jgi:levanase
LGEVDGDAQLIAVELHPEAARDVGVCVRVGAHERTVVGYDTETATLYVDRSRSGQVGFADQFAGVHRAPAQIGPEGGLALTIVVDRCSVEVFTQDGSCVITEQIFPGPDSTGIELFACGGSAVVDLSVTALDRTDWCTR